MDYALKNKDFNTLYILGHGFKGAARNYGLNELGEIFLLIEKAGKNKNSEIVVKNLKKVFEYIEQVEIISHKRYALL
ncbi:hypothetical protein GMMP15_750023 [Candidatus Magnetomoraceae bacterium gMMP-15]